VVGKKKWKNAAREVFGGAQKTGQQPGTIHPEKKKTRAPSERPGFGARGTLKHAAQPIKSRIAGEATGKAEKAVGVKKKERKQMVPEGGNQKGGQEVKRKRRTAGEMKIPGAPGPDGTIAQEAKNGGQNK